MLHTRWNTEARTPFATLTQSVLSNIIVQLYSELTAIYAPHDPQSRCRSHESTPTRQPTKPLNGTKPAEIEKNLQ